MDCSRCLGGARHSRSRWCRTRSLGGPGSSRNAWRQLLPLSGVAFSGDLGLVKKDPDFYDRAERRLGIVGHGADCRLPRRHAGQRRGRPAARLDRQSTSPRTGTGRTTWPRRWTKLMESANLAELAGERCPSALVLAPLADDAGTRGRSAGRAHEHVEAPLEPDDLNVASVGAPPRRPVPCGSGWCAPSRRAGALSPRRSPRTPPHATSPARPRCPRRRRSAPPLRRGRRRPGAGSPHASPGPDPDPGAPGRATIRSRRSGRRGSARPRDPARRRASRPRRRHR